MKGDGSPLLWLLEAIPSDDQEQEDPLSLPVQAVQLPPAPDSGPLPEKLPQLPGVDESWEEIISRRVFGRAEPPRWVLLMGAGQVLLLDRTKWNEKRSLRFDLVEILGRLGVTTLQAVAALLHRESICPEDGFCLIDTLSEQSHKHAFAVSEDLKFALREAIELLGNEAIRSMKQDRIGVYDRDLADVLTRECLRFMYRLLFLFYVEARPELGFSAMKSEAYRLGYSLEGLRDLELVPLTTDEACNGAYLHQSVKQLFQLIHDGYSLKARQRTLQNSYLQSAELLSLSRADGKKNKRRGRISYSQLGINQLGAVYEALLSFSGFFAETDLYELKKTKNEKRESNDEDEIEAETETEGGDQNLA